ncbi:MAG: WD40 repeat domain-containing protein, partial [Planctomycetota bacterium]
RPHQAPVYDVAPTGVDRTVITAGADGYVKANAAAPADDSIPAYESFAGGAKFLGDGRLVTWGYDPDGNSLKLWRLADGGATAEKVMELDTGAIHVTDVAVLPSRQEIAYVGFEWRSGSREPRNELAIWGLVSDERRPLMESIGRTRELLLSKGGDRLFASVGNTLAVVDLSESEEVRQIPFEGDGVLKICRHPVSDVIAVGEWLSQPPHRVTILQAEHLSQDFERSASVATLDTGDDMIWSLDISSDGKLAAGTSSGDILVWQDFAQASPLRLTGHVANAYRVRFSPSGNRLASAGLDGTVRFWNPITGNELLHFATKTAWNYHVSFSPDGDTIAYSGGVGTFSTPICFIRSEENR